MDIFSSVHVKIHQNRSCCMSLKKTLRKGLEIYKVYALIIIKLKVNNKEVTGKSPNTWKPNSTFLNNPWTKEEVSREKKKIFK